MSSHPHDTSTSLSTSTIRARDDTSAASPLLPLSHSRPSDDDDEASAATAIATATASPSTSHHARRAPPRAPARQHRAPQTSLSRRTTRHGFWALLAAPLRDGYTYLMDSKKTIEDYGYDAVGDDGVHDADGNGPIDSTENLAATHHDRAVWESRDTYVASGLAGLFASPYVVACAAFSALGGLIFGYDQGVVSVILVMPQFLDVFDRVAPGHASAGFWKGLLTAMIELGAFVGALNQGWIADKISRKYSIVVAVCIFTVGSALQTGAISYPMLVVARLIGGIGIGMLSMVAPLYIAEISPPEIRGTLLMLEEFSIVLGIVIAYWITYGTQYMHGDWAWRLPFLLQMIPSTILGAGILFLPFSPRWLAQQGRDPQSLAALSKLRRLPPDDKRVRQEWFDIKAEVAVQNEAVKERHPRLYASTAPLDKVRLEIAAWADLFRKNCWRRTNVGAGIMFFQQLVGINALIYYSPTLFATMGQDHSRQLLLSGILNVTQLVGVATSVWTMDRIGRKPLLLFGSLCMFSAHFVIAILVGLYSSDWPAHRGPGWVSVGFLFFYMLAFGATWGPVPWALPAEVFPSSLRAKGVAISTCSNWLFNFAVGLFTPPLVDNTNYGAYVFFAVFCLLSFVWTLLFVKETRGRTLEQMDHVFGDSNAATDAARRRRVEREIAHADAAAVAALDGGDMERDGQGNLRRRV